MAEQATVGGDWQIVPAGGATALQVARLRQVFWQNQMDAGLREPVPACDEDSVLALAERPRTHLLIAQRGGEVGGYLLGITKLIPGGVGRVSSVEEVFVDPGARRDRVGERLVAAAMEAFRNDGADRIQLRVLANNPAGEAFWIRQGFTAYVTTFEL